MEPFLAVRLANMAAYANPRSWLFNRPVAALLYLAEQDARAGVANPAALLEAEVMAGLRPLIDLSRAVRGLAVVEPYSPPECHRCHEWIPVTGYTEIGQLRYAQRCRMCGCTRRTRAQRTAFTDMVMDRPGTIDLRSALGGAR